MKHRHDKPAMQPKSDAHPGLEQDARGLPIPIKDRLPEDRAKVKRASRKKSD